MGVRFCVSYKGQDNELGSCMQREGCFSYSVTNQLALRHTKRMGQIHITA